MTVRVAINGFGRIGRNYLRAAKASNADIDFVAINDLGSIDMMASLLKHDSVHGRFPEKVSAGTKQLRVGKDRITVLSERDPEKLPWEEMKIDVVIESTGVFNSKEKASAHLRAGANKVLISAPATCDATFVLGVNDHTYNPDRHHVISNASCTTNCFAPMVKVLDDKFGTGAAKATGLVMKKMAGRLDGMALRVPIPDGSLTDFTVVLKKPATVEQINAAFKQSASKGPLKGIMAYSEDPLVSSDIIGRPESCIFDSGLTMSMGTLVKVAGWYDNEMGYSTRLVELTIKVGKTKSKKKKAAAKSSSAKKSSAAKKSAAASKTSVKKTAAKKSVSTDRRARRARGKSPSKA